MTRMWMSTVWRTCLVATLAAGVGCDLLWSDDPTRSASDAVVNGTEVDKPQESTLVYLEAPDLRPGAPSSGIDPCTGTLLRSDLVLAAKHCFGRDPNVVIPPGWVSARLGGENQYPASQQRHGRAIVRHPNEFVDVALLWLDSAFDVPGYATGFHRNQGNYFVPGSTKGDIVGASPTQTCFGYGRAIPGGITGVLRAASLPPAPGDPDEHDEYYLLPLQNPVTTLYPGDSGGPCFLGALDPQASPANYQLAGVIRGLHPELPDGGVPDPAGVAEDVIVAAPAFANWVTVMDRSSGFDQGLLDPFDSYADVTSAWFETSTHILSFDFYKGARFGVDSQILTLPVGYLPGASPDFSNYRAAVGIGDFNGDQAPDVFGIISALPGVPASLPLPGTPFDGPFMYLDGPLDLASILDPANAVELLASANAHFSSSFVPVDWSGNPQAYSSFHVSRLHDRANDSYDDLEAVMADGGGVDVYYGGPNGLAPGVRMQGFPTALSDDGKFVTVTGKGNATTEQAQMGFWISIHPSQTVFSLEVFDGDIRGMNDHPTGPDDVTCFSLWEAKNQQKGNLIEMWDQSDIQSSDNAWQTLYRGPNVGELTGDPTYGSHYMYLLEVKIGSGSCDATGTPTAEAASAAMNALKVRTSLGDDPNWHEGPWVEGNGTGYGGGQMSFIARDIAGEHARMTQGLMAPDTTFDGDFSFWIDVGPNATEMQISDADADLLSDGQPAHIPTDGQPHSCDDADYPPAGGDIARGGVAVGANDSIEYILAYLGDDGLSHKRYEICNPSGSWSPGVETFERRTFPTTDENGNSPPSFLWQWYWTNVDAENNVMLEPVSGSPLAYAMFGSPRPKGARPPMGVAIPLDYWAAQTGRLASYLPVTIGSGSAANSIGTVEQALELLDASTALGGGNGSKVTLCHKPPGNPDNVHAITVGGSAVATHLAHGDDIRPPRSMTDLEAELLVALLNVKAAAAAGEDLLAGHVYGREESVNEVIDEAQHVVTDMTAACRLDANALDRVDLLTRILQSVNAGGVTYLPRPHGPIIILQGQRQVLTPAHKLGDPGQHGY